MKETSECMIVSMTDFSIVVTVLAMLMTFVNRLFKKGAIENHNEFSTGALSFPCSLFL